MIALFLATATIIGPFTIQEHVDPMTDKVTVSATVGNDDNELYFKCDVGKRPRIIVGVSSNTFSIKPVSPDHKVMIRFDKNEPFYQIWKTSRSGAFSAFEEDAIAFAKEATSSNYVRLRFVTYSDPIDFRVPLILANEAMKEFGRRCGNSKLVGALSSSSK